MKQRRVNRKCQDYVYINIMKVTKEGELNWYELVPIVEGTDKFSLLAYIYIYQTNQFFIASVMYPVLDR